MFVAAECIPILRDRPIGICAGRRLIVNMLKIGHGNGLHLKLFLINSGWAAARALIGWPALLLGCYFLAALAGSFIPANGRWREPANGVEIFVETNQVHVSLIVPIRHPAGDLSDLIHREDVIRARPNQTHAIIGWGHGAVYRSAERWADVRSGDIASAIVGSNETTLHITHITRPRPGLHRKAFRVSAAQYRHIIRDIRASFRLTGGRSVAHRAYGPNDMFYESRGHYSALRTCNEWTGAILRRAGVRMGIWTPMPGGVMRWF